MAATQFYDKIEYGSQSPSSNLIPSRFHEIVGGTCSLHLTQAGVCKRDYTHTQKKNKTNTSRRNLLVFFLQQSRSLVPISLHFIITYIRYVSTNSFNFR